jgi:hypothetical protein
MKLSVFLFLFLIHSALFAQEHKIKDAKINECSGLVCSSKSDSLIWVHNDSGDQSKIYLINSNGETIAHYNFNKKVRDCEDIAIWKRKNNKAQIFVGDIGDNDNKRGFITVFQFDEPSLKMNDKEQLIENVKTFNFVYPDGARDAECLMFDPIEEKLIIVSKREDSVSVYTAFLNNLKTDQNTLTKEATLYFPGLGFTRWITAGDISTDGTKIIIKSYAQVYYWDRKNKQSVSEAMLQPHKLLKYKPEPQGEAIGFTNQAKQFYTISEGKGAVIYLRNTN